MDQIQQNSGGNSEQKIVEPKNWMRNLREPTLNELLEDARAILQKCCTGDDAGRVIS